MKINIKLFHGTSTLFLDSIIEMGLGDKNPLNNYDAYDFIKEMYTAGENIWGTNLNHSWQVEKIVLQGMAKQKITRGGFNWRHGNAYLTPGISRALNYAIHNEYGSELLSNCLRYYQRIKRRYPDYQFSEMVDKSPIMNLLDKTFEPILIEIPPGLLDTSDVDGENNQEVIEQVKGLKEMDLTKPDDEMIAGQMNFRLLRTVQADQLRFFNTILTTHAECDYKLKEIFPCVPVI